MNTLMGLYPGDAATVMLACVIVQVTVVFAVAVAAGWWWAAERPAVRHGVYLAALLCGLASPAVVWAGHAAGWGVLTVPVGAEVAEARPTMAEAPAAELEWEQVAAEGHAAASNVPPAHETSDAGDAPAAPSAAAPTPVVRADVWRLLVLAAMALWGIGFLLMIARLGHGWRRTSRLRHRALPADGSAAAVLASISRSLGLRRPPRLLASTELPGPVAIGLTQPTIILPEPAWRQWSAEQLRHVLLHEAAHIARRDPWIGLIQRLAEAIYWFHPLVHMLNRSLARAREEVCDNHVLHAARSTDYAHTLLHVATAATPSPAADFALLQPRWNLEDRIRVLLDPARHNATRLTRRQLVPIALVVVAVLSAVLLIAPGFSADVRADDADAQDEALLRQILEAHEQALRDFPAVSYEMSGEASVVEADEEWQGRETERRSVQDDEHHSFVAEHVTTNRATGVVEREHDRRIVTPAMGARRRSAEFAAVYLRDEEGGYGPGFAWKFDWIDIRLHAYGTGSRWITADTFFDGPREWRAETFADEAGRELIRAVGTHPEHGWEQMLVVDLARGGFVLQIREYDEAGNLSSATLREPEQLPTGHWVPRAVESYRTGWGETDRRLEELGVEPDVRTFESRARYQDFEVIERVAPEQVELTHLELAHDAFVWRREPDGEEVRMSYHEDGYLVREGEDQPQPEILGDQRGQNAERNRSQDIEPTAEQITLQLSEGPTHRAVLVKPGQWYPGPTEPAKAIEEIVGDREGVNLVVEHHPRTDEAELDRIREAAEAVGHPVQFRPADWWTRFENAYGLEEGQVLRRIGPPFPPERERHYQVTQTHVADEHPVPPAFMRLSVPEGADVSDARQWYTGFTIPNPDPATLADLLERVVRVPLYAVEDRDHLLETIVDGDWTVRQEASEGERVAALEQILREDLDWPVRLEMQRLEREVLRVAGEASLEPGDTLHVYADPESPHSVGIGGSFGTFLENLGNRLELFVIDETDQRIRVILTRYHADTEVSRNHPEREAMLERILANVAEQTGLEFAVQRREVEVWVVTLAE